MVLRRRAGPAGIRQGEWPVHAWRRSTDPVRGVPSPWRDLMSDRPSGGRDRVNVLIVEDDAAMAEMYRIQLDADGYRVRVVGTAKDALAAIDRSSPDLVLLDILLPGADGFGVLERMRSATAAAPAVVILSNYGEQAMVDRGLSLGALAYFVKSRVTPDLVSRSIPDWLDRARRASDR